MRLTHRLIFAVVAFVLSACSGNEPSSSLSTNPGSEKLVLTLSANTDTIPEATSKTLTARVTDQTGVVRPATVAWRSTDVNIATVANGLITGVAQGVASVIASTAGAADSALIVVTENGVTVDVQPSEVEMAAGDTIDFVATLRTRSGDVIPVGSFVWSASDTLAASFIAAGLLHARQEAEITVTAEAMMRRGTSRVRIFRSPVATVTLTPSTANIYRSEAVDLVPMLRDRFGRLVDREVTWGSSDPSKARVQNGRVIGVGVGTVVITATAETKTASATVTVMNPAAAALDLNLPSATLAVGTEMQATITATDASGAILDGKMVAYQSANPSIATVTSSGRVRGIADGSTTISAIVDGIVARRGLEVRGGRPTSLSIWPSAPSVNIGQQSQLSAMVFDESGNVMPSQPISWSSSNPASISVSSSGMLQGVGAGSSVITATSGIVSQSVTASISNAPVWSVRVLPSSLSLSAGQQGSVIAEALDANNVVLTGRVVSWSSQNPTVATITTSGVVTAVATGSTILVATIEGKSANLPITVTAAPQSPVAAVAVSLGTNALSPGQTTQAAAVLTDASGSVLNGRTIQWYSLDPGVALVSSTGLVTAHGGGTVAIMASSEGKSGSASLTVSSQPAAPVARVEINVPKQNISVGEQVQSTLKLFDAAGSMLSPNGRTISYRSDNSAIISVSAGGVITGTGNGTTTMRVTTGSVSGTATFYVTGSASAAPVASIVVSPSSGTLSVGQTMQASASARDAQGTPISGTTFTWTTSNASVATISSYGLVTAVATGTVAIHAASSGVTGGMAVNVNAPPTSSNAVASVTVTLSPWSISVGGNSQATAVARNASGAVIGGKTPTWSLGGSLLASVTSSGMVSGLLPGVLPVTASIDGVSGSASLTISLLPTNPPPSPPPTTTTVELPRTYLNYSFPATTGQTIVVSSGGNLQQALNNAQRGDEIVLAAGATFTGNYTLPAKSGSASNGWIVIRSERLNQLPSIGTRVTSAYASLMPKIVTPNTAPAVRLAAAASGWWMAGVEVTVASSVTQQQYGLIFLGESGSGQATLSSVPSDIVLDRMYVHGQSNTQLSRCIALNSARTQITDSYIVECHGKGFDSQAILGWNGPGPYKIVNNTLQGAGENIMFGGSDPNIPGLVPSDIEIRRNYVYTPVSWKGVWTKKNLLELKNAARVLIEANVFEGSWLDGQTGTAIMFRSANQDGRCRWCRTTDVTFRQNYVTKAAGGVTFIGGSGSAVDTTARRIVVTESVFESIGVAPFTGEQRGFQFNEGPADITLDRTVLTGSLNALIYIDRNSPTQRGTLRNSVWTLSLIMADGLPNASQALATAMPGYSWSGITLLGSGSASLYPSGTSIVASEAQAANAAQIRSAVQSAVAGVIIP